MTGGPRPEIRIEIVTVTPFRQNCQLIRDPATGRGIVVDPGGDVPHLLERIGALGLSVEAILLTHGHLDHAGGAAALRDALPRVAGDAPVPLIGPHRADAFLLDGIAEQARSFGIADMGNAVPDRWLEHGERLQLAGCLHLEVRHLPGHTPGHVVFVEHDHRLALVGDTLFHDSVGRTDFPYGDQEALLRGIRDQLLPLGDDVSFIPGHGPTSTVGQERRANLFLN